MDVRDMEAEAERIAAMSPREREAYDAQLLEHRISLGLVDAQGLTGREALLAMAVAFREYEAHHRAKDEPGRNERAERNRRLAEVCEALAAMPPHHDRHPWCQPGDRPEREWMLLFDDQDMRTMRFGGPGAEERARAAYTQFAPAWNCYLFAAVPAVPFKRGDLCPTCGAAEVLTTSGPAVRGAVEIHLPTDDQVLAAMDANPLVSRPTWWIAELIEAALGHPADRSTVLAAVRAQLDDMEARGLVRKDPERSLEGSVSWCVAPDPTVSA